MTSTACGGGEEPEGEGARRAQAGGFETVEEGVLTVGSNIPFPPFEFREGGELTGFDVEMVEEIADRLGLMAEFVPAGFDSLFPQLGAGRWDMIASATTITPGRDRTIDFTIPYYEAQQALTVNREQTPDIESVEDLDEGDVVAVQRATTGEAYARENFESKGVEVRSFPEGPDTYTALEAADVTAVLFDEPSAVDAADRRPSLEVVETIDTDEQYGFGVNPENDALRAEVNRVLREMIDDGTYTEIYERWFPRSPGGSVVPRD